MLLRVSCIALLGGAVVILIARLMLKRMLNRLVDLDMAMEQLETGNFYIQFDEDQYEDEVSRIKWRFRKMARRLQKMMDENVMREKAQKEAELQALQSQINPHFLFNTLETMRMQCEIDRYYKVGNALMALGEMFRYIIRMKEYKVPFYLEWENLKNYIALMSLRLDDDLIYELHCDEKAKNVTVPKLFLQPLVENSFTHGFKGVSAPWYLNVCVEIQEGKMKVWIRDNGSGVPQDELRKLQNAMKKRKTLIKTEENRQSIGIINVLQRIDRTCIAGSDITIANQELGGIEICVTIVLEE